MKNDATRAKLSELEALLRSMGASSEIGVALSGGVDSLTLAAVAHAVLGSRAAMFHARSPAVPFDATARVEAMAAARGWRLEVFDAGEFGRAEYVANPVDRCFYCKTSLYGAMRARTGAQLLSGTNLDDLGEYRPGLQAAGEHAVRHPYVEVGADKEMVRAMARLLGLGSVAELAAAPCLASRIETGIGIDAAMLSLVHASERLIGAAVAARTVRCRVRATGVVLEIDAAALEAIEPQRRAELADEVGGIFAGAGYPRPVSFAPYRNGSAFLIRRVERAP
ncbi:MAG: adenine nucleotide alpha hydrolase [Burkholderiales bacterium]|nr:adenine nucleotide alpha hydrolase [Burkholderiales bacterium]